MIVLRIIFDLLVRLNSSYKWMKYERYLNTWAWRNRRQILFWMRGERCEECEREYLLNVHHLTYEHRGYERPWELKILCARCHRDAHGLI